MIEQAPVYAEYASAANDCVPEKGERNIAAGDESHDAYAMLFRPLHIPPRDAYEARKEQRFGHHPEESDILTSEASDQLADHQCADHSTLNAPSRCEAGHDQFSGACSRMPTTSIQPMK